MRTEFPARVKVEAFKLAKGCCEQCQNGRKLLAGDIFYDHRIADGLNGEPTLENCSVLCRSHHDIKTRTKDVPAIAKAKRLERRRAGVKKPRTITAWRRFDGSIRYAGRER
jgi:hypothetical protein